MQITKFIFTDTLKEMMMQKNALLLMFMMALLVVAPSCNSNKIACPAYADSVPESKKSKKPDAPAALPKASKSHVSNSMKPGGR